MSRIVLPLVVGLTAAIALAACGSGGDEGSAGGGGAAKTIEIVETDFKLDPATVTLDEPGTYTFRAVNEGGTVHALELEGNGIEEETEEIQPGGSAELTVEITEAGEYEIYCPVDGHKEKGMEGSVTLGGAGGGATTEKTTTEDSGDGGYGYG